MPGRGGGPVVPVADEPACFSPRPLPGRRRPPLAALAERHGPCGYGLGAAEDPPTEGGSGGVPHAALVRPDNPLLLKLYARSDMWRLCGVRVLCACCAALRGRYDAVVLRARPISASKGPAADGPRYEAFVHFQGWKKTHDQWVRGDKVLVREADDPAPSGQSLDIIVSATMDNGLTD